jgi:hypothetical protein
MEAMLARLFQDRLTLWNLVVCALTAAKGVSGSGASMIAIVCGGLEAGRCSTTVEAEDCCVVLYGRMRRWTGASASTTVVWTLLKLWLGLALGGRLLKC